MVSMKTKNLMAAALAAGLVCSGTASAADRFIADYDASAGSPVGAGDVESPLIQGFTPVDLTLDVTDIQEGVIDGGSPAWRNLDALANNAPGYQVALSGLDYQGMYDNGWHLSYTARLEQGGQFIYWGGDGGNTAGGFAFPGDRRVGVSLSVGADVNDYNVSVVGTGSAGPAVVTGGILNDLYFTADITGIAGTDTFDVVIKETLSGTVLLNETGLTFAGGNSSTDAHTAFMSGSSSGDNRESFTRNFSLTTLDVGLVKVIIDRGTGNISLGNTTGSTIADIIGYSVTSDAGGLDSTGWNKFSTATPLANDNDAWTVLSASGSATDLSEAVLDTAGAGDGGDVVATTGTVDFGNVWVASPFEDVDVEILLDNGDILVSNTDFIIEYIGGDSLAFGDLDGSGVIDLLDWAAFKAAYGSDLTGIDTTLERYVNGDLTDDGVSDLSDFDAFRNAYDAANGAGAFAAAVPEPTSLALLGLGALALGRRRRK